MIKIWTRAVGVSVLLAGACAGPHQEATPAPGTPAQHRQEAQREERAAAEHEKRFDPGSWQPPPPSGGDYRFTVPVYNPTQWHRDEADLLRAHAAQHRRIATQLEQFEQAECRNFPPSARAACPLLGPLTKIEDIPGGVRATFAANTRIDAILAHMRCHYAYALARGFPDVADCPLYLRGIEIRAAADPLAVEVVSADPKVAAAIRERSREEAVFLQRGGDSTRP